MSRARARAKGKRRVVGVAHREHHSARRAACARPLESRPLRMRLFRILVPRLVLAAALAVAAPGAAQSLTIPQLDWRTIETKHFTILYPRRAERWTRDVASRIEAVHDAVSALVGHAPSARVTIIVEDPNNLANGFALPALGDPVIFFWPTPPGPSSGIGDSPGWGEILSVHEYAHIAHLTRRSRNPLQRILERASPIGVGPLALESPRWVIEGYATFVEGRLTGSGRPHSAWRAAVLREWAREGQLPSYGQLDGDPRFAGGSMAYLVGSAYLQWLVDRGGDSSLVHLWRRMSARRVRTFDEAFAGVFGGEPADLYGRFTAELTGKALEAERDVHAARGPAGDSAAGRLVQRLAWTTGSPAVSPDGSRIALVLGTKRGPRKVVVWSVQPPPEDSAAVRARERELKLDPEDVAAIPWQPPPRRALAVLYPHGGLPYAAPRFLPDGHRLLLVRATSDGDGAARGDLFIWDSRDGAVRRVTHAGGFLGADPAPDGRTAAAQRCVEGICDLVRVDLGTGRFSTLAAGAPRVVYERPRWSPDGRRVAASVQADGRWHVALLDVAAGSADPPRIVGSSDGANRYDPAFLNDSTLVVISDASGIPNVELLDVATGRARPLTRVVSAALAPEPDRATGDVYFLRLQPHGLDLAAVPDSVSRAPFATSPALAPAVPIPVVAADSFAAAAPPAGRAYGFGPRRAILLPTLGYAADGKRVGLMLAGTDPVGRFTWIAQGMYGDRGSWRGGSLAAAWRGSLPWLTGELFYAEDYPSRQHGGVAVPGSLDGSYRGGAMQAELPRDWLTNAMRVRVGASMGRLSGGALGARDRELLSGSYGGAFRQTPGEWTVDEQLGVVGQTGRTGGGDWSRWTASGALRLGTRGFAVDLRAAYGEVTRSADSFEQFVLGGTAPPLYGDALLVQRVAMPALPVGVAAGRRFAMYRASLPLAGLRAYFWGGSAGDALGRWHQVVGLEGAFHTDGIWPIRVPGVQILGGVGYSLSEPVRHDTQVYLTIDFRP